MANVPPKRRRLRHVVNKLREKLEFFFSEPNLRRDDYLRSIVGSSGTRPMPIVSLVKFNSLFEISDNIQLYRRAAHTSKVLRLADIVSGDQGAIARRDPLPPPPRDVLQKTVYVEGLPKDATIQWLQNLIGALSRHKPSFVSVPRLRTGHSRGFAFLEFASQSHAASVAKDLNAKKAQSTAFFLQSSRRKLFHNQMRLRQLQTLDGRETIVLPPPSPQFMTRAERDVFLGKDVVKEAVPVAAVEAPAVEGDQCSKIESDKMKQTNDHCTQKRKRKDSPVGERPRKRDRSEEEVFEVVPHKQVKLDIVENVVDPDKDLILHRRARTNSFPPLSGCTLYHGWQYWSGTIYEPTAANKQDKAVQTEQQGRNRNWSQRTMEKKIEQLVKQGRNEAKKRKIQSKIHVPVNNKKRRKTRLRKKRRLHRIIKRRRSSASMILPNWGGLRLKAIMANEWAQMKRKYKEIQKQNMRKLKQSLKDSTFLFAGAALRKHIMYDEFLANTSDNEDADESSTEMENDFNLPEPKRHPMLDPRGSRRPGQAPIFRPGVIVEITSEVDLPSPTQLRTRFSEYGCVAYVDRVSARAGFVRFNNQSGAQSSIEKEDYYSLRLLTGQREEQYWEMLINKREAKRSGERKKCRGVERLVKKAIKQKTKERKLHILFDSDFENS